MTGSVEVTSDGITLVKSETEIEGVVVNDGLPCDRGKHIIEYTINYMSTYLELKKKIIYRVNIRVYDTYKPGSQTFSSVSLVSYFCMINVHYIKRSKKYIIMIKL